MTRRFLAGQVDTTITFREDTWAALVKIGKALPHGGVEPETLAASIVKEFVRRQAEHDATGAGPERKVIPPRVRSTVRPDQKIIDRDKVRDLHAQGLSDPDIAHALGASGPAIWRVRSRELKLPSNFRPGGQRR